MKHYANLGKYSKYFVEFFIYDSETNKRIGSVFFISDMDTTIWYKVNDEIDDLLIKKLERVASEIMWHENRRRQNLKVHKEISLWTFIIKININFQLKLIFIIFSPNIYYYINKQ